MKPENLSSDLELTYRNYFSEECVDNGGLRGRHEGGSPRLSSPLLSSSSLSTFSPTDSGQPSPDHRAQYVQLKNERMDYRYIGVLWALTSSHANCQTTNSWNPSHGRLYFSDWRGKWDVCLGVDRQMRPAGQVSHQAVLRADQGSVTTWEFYKQRDGGGGGFTRLASLHLPVWISSTLLCFASQLESSETIHFHSSAWEHSK